MRLSPLRHFTFYSTRDPEVARTILSGAGVTAYDIVDKMDAYEQRVNRVLLRDLSMYYSACSSGIHMEFAAVDFMRQRICVAGAGRSSFGKTSNDLTPSRWSAVMPAGERGRFDFGAGYEELRMVVDHSVIRRKLGAMIGDGPVDHVAFAADADVRSPGLARYRRLLSFLLLELEGGGSQAPGAVVNEISEALLVSYLCGQKHNYTSRLLKLEFTPSSAQQRAAEDYIAAHWNEPLSIEDIASAANVSARSLFRSFKETHGCSPFQYIKQMRLEHARAMLIERDQNTGVIGVALKCGFHSLGHFAQSYRHAFGELPSKTAQR